MRIHILINDINRSGGGAQKVALELHKGLLARGEDSSLVALEPIQDSELNSTGVLTLGVSVHRLPAALNSLVRYFREAVQDGDVVHVHLFPTLLLAPIAKTLARRSCRMVMTEHNTVNGRRGRWLGRLIDAFIYPRYDSIVCISEGTRAELAGWMPSQGKRALVVTNGIDLPFGEPARRSVRRRLVVLSLGRLVEQKDYPTALQVISHLADLDLEYRIAGTGPLLETLEGEAERLGIGERVRFLGFRSDVENLLKDADIFLLTSAWEGFGLVAVEAMNAALPLVCSDVLGLREVVGSSGDCGILVQPGAPEEFAGALRRLIGDRWLREQMGHNGFQRSCRFGVEQMVEGYLDVYADSL